MPLSLLLTLNRTKSFLLELLFPTQCIGCANAGVLLCQQCLERLAQFKAPVCPVCQRRLSGSPLTWHCQNQEHGRPLRFILAPAPYEAPLMHKTVALLKYQGVTSLILPLAEAVAVLMRQYNWSDFQIVPIPLHSAKFRQRGFNQAELLAQQIGANLGLPILAALKKIKNPKAQVGLKQTERWRNQVGAFVCVAQEKVQNKNILLVDDVFTTGATLKECAKILKAAGARKVGAVVLAR